MKHLANIVNQLVSDVPENRQSCSDATSRTSISSDSNLTSTSNVKIVPKKDKVDEEKEHKL